MLRQSSASSSANQSIDAGGGEGLTFAGACEALAVASADLTALREAGLVACVRRKGRQVYPRAALRLSRILLALGRERDWEPATLCWYADLVFAAQVGRTILLPSLSLGGARRARRAGALPTRPAPGWRPSHVAAVLRDLGPGGLDDDEVDELVVGTLRSLVAIALGAGRALARRGRPAPLGPLPDRRLVRAAAARRSSARRGAIARDAPQAFMALVLAFTTIAPPTRPGARRNSSAPPTPS